MAYVSIKLSFWNFPFISLIVLPSCKSVHPLQRSFLKLNKDLRYLHCVDHVPHSASYTVKPCTNKIVKGLFSLPDHSVFKGRFCDDVDCPSAIVRPSVRPSVRVSTISLLKRWRDVPCMKLYQRSVWHGNRNIFYFNLYIIKIKRGLISFT